MIEIHPVQLAIQAATFLVAVWVLWRFLWKPLRRAMDARRTTVAADLQAAHESRARAEQLEQEYRARLAVIDEEARTILKRAGDESARAREALLADARAEARRLIETAGREIEAEKARALASLRAETANLAVLIAEKVMRQSVDKKVQARLVDEFVKELGNG